MFNGVIAIDGPAGAGKSTIAKIVARELDLRYLDTGAMYRAIALKASRLGFGPEDGDEVAHFGSETTIEFGPGDPQRVLLDGEDVTDAIRTPEIGELASALSTHSGVRKELVERQKRMVALGRVILEGRDATTVVAPHAEVKVYLTASLEERARRRHLEYETKGMGSTYNQVRQDVDNRDHRDITRDDSPLLVAPDAHVIESGGLAIQDVAAKIIGLACNKV